MTTVLTGGLGKNDVATVVRELGLDGLEAVVSSDMDAAMKLRAGQADYYLGTCHTGAGASLGVLVGLLGSGACHTFGRSVPTEEEVAALLRDGRRAFGLGVDRIAEAVPVIARAMAARGG